MSALRKSNHIKALLASLNEDGPKRSDAEAQDALEDLVAYVLDVSHAKHNKIEAYDGEKIMLAILSKQFSTVSHTALFFIVSLTESLCPNIKAHRM